MSTDWGGIVRDLMRENGISTRNLAKVSGINRSSIIRFLAGDTSLHTNQIERLFDLLGYEFDCVKTGDIHASLLKAQPAGRSPKSSIGKIKIIRLACMKADY